MSTEAQVSLDRSYIGLLLSVLESVQWSAPQAEVPDAQPAGFCPECGKNQIYREHLKGCSIGSAIIQARMHLNGINRRRIHGLH